ncbi:toxin glutamine deamidase domain-containing protein [Actinoallomurus iriomotensis]|uniref:Tox-PL domain-containing protein n=1 Tax=Actinoallomurus iriomotensis TaxID=478107 RepID=A0A9W6RVK9_9ACTN|nr:toxin glutamine deamidase domain-containing protein [Actinoallomurus iriomotensis]GLY83441.1 hypothetical protein Airi02_013710 [Actinoallomurus iriomotensis]
MVGGSRLFEVARQFLRPPIEDLLPRDTARLGGLAKFPARDEELLRAGYEEVKKVLKEARGRPLTADELRRAVQYTNPLKVNGLVQENCSRCAMAVDDILHARPAVAGNITDPPKLDALLDLARTRITGEVGDIIGGKSGDFRDIESFLLAKGSGAQGILHTVTSLADGAGHAANAANIDGKVYYVDGQVGLVEDFVPAAEKYFEIATFLRTR